MIIPNLLSSVHGVPKLIDSVLVLPNLIDSVHTILKLIVSVCSVPSLIRNLSSQSLIPILMLIAESSSIGDTETMRFRSVYV